MATRLSKKEKGFVKDIAKGETGVEAALANYDTDDYMTAANIASENLKKPKILSALEEALPDELLAQVHKEGLQATKKSGVGGMLLSLKGGNEGTLGHTDIQEPDYAVRHKYLDSAYKLKGSYAAEKHVTLNVEIEPSEDLKEYADALLGQQKTA